MSLKAQDIPLALAHLEKTLSYREAALEKGMSLPGKEEISVDPFDATLRTFDLYLTCYHVVKAAQDPRAKEILHSAYSLLQERSERIEDLQKRQTFLANVRSHREIVIAWETV